MPAALIQFMEASVSHLSVLAVVGAQWGDEGKGKVVGYLAERARLVARYGGGANAGHTVVLRGEEYRLHQVPSGVLFSGCMAVVGNGAVVDPAGMLKELAELEARGVDTSRVFLSERAHVVMPYHHLLDRLQEQARGAGRIGTTGLGIGPAYTDKVSRDGIRLAELVDRDALARRLAEVLPARNVLLERLYGQAPLSLEELVDRYGEYGERLRPRVTDTTGMVRQAIDRGDRVLLEGAQGTLLDVDFGTYPFVTSSSTTVQGAAAGLGIAPWSIRGAIGVMKAYATRVGEGPFPTEQPGDIGRYLRERGHEYGTTTGRPRRCGWLDLVIVRWAVRIGAVTSLAMTLLDVLSGLGEVKIGVAYRLAPGRPGPGHPPASPASAPAPAIGLRADGARLLEFPPRIGELDRYEVEYETLPGWREEIGACRRYEDLPANARRYVERVEALTGVPVVMVSVGRDTSQTIERADPFSAAAR